MIAPLNPKWVMAVLLKSNTKERLCYGAYFEQIEIVAMNTQEPYSIHLDVRYAPLEAFDIQELIDACTHPWYNQTLCRVNDCVLRLGILQGEFHWHKHDREDELFYVVEGRLLIDLEGHTVELSPRQGFLVPKGVRHRTRALERTVILMIEGAGVSPTGNK